MTTLAAARIGALIVLACLTGPAWAQSDPCGTGIKASARAPNGLNFDPPRHYDTQKLAQSRAITAWQTAVSSTCPRYSTSWRRAQDKKFDCEGYAGGISCEASAKPARRRLAR